MPYFHIMTGLRGCYMPSESYVVYAKTRRALKEAIRGEAERYRDSGYIGCNKRQIAWIAKAAWQSRHRRNGKRVPAPYPFVMPFAPPHAPRNYCEGVFASPATRAEWKESQESEQ